MQKGFEKDKRKEKKDRCFIIIVVAIRERVSVVYPHLLAAEPPTIHVLIVVIIVIVIAIVVLIILKSRAKGKSSEFGSRKSPWSR